MKKRTIGIIGVILTFVFIYCFFSWPLPLHFTTGIPSSDRNIEKPNYRSMIAGDHIQLMYHFFLLHETVTGHIPPFTNPYEFNSAEKSYGPPPDTYYLPYSLVFSAVLPITNRATAWNIAGLISILISFVFTFALVKRYVKNDLLVLAGAVVGTCFPYRWVTLLTGSPTGFAISFVPALLLGMDTAIREHKISGGFLAGFAFLFCYFTDIQIFYFLALTLPAFFLLTLFASFPSTNRKQHFKSAAVAIAPLVALALIAIFFSLWTTKHLASSGMSGGRTEREVMKYSPLLKGLYSWKNLGMSNHLFFGIFALSLLLPGIAVSSCELYSRKWSLHKKDASIFLLLCFFMVSIIVLALGMNGPFSGAAIKLCRKIIPKYTMIRQTVKIYAVLPSFFAIASALSLQCLLQRVRTPHLARALAVLLVALAVGEWRSQIKPTICLLDNHNEAYEKIAINAKTAGHSPRTIAIPIWPGDSHWASLYQYYTSLYRIPMLNGYLPAVSKEYKTEIFHALESVNQGVITDLQFDLLNKLGVFYLTFHEDAFPDQVSPFPSAFALNNLLACPRLELIATDEDIWAFRIKETPAEYAPIKNAIFFSNRGWEMEKVLEGAGTPIEDSSANAGFAIQLESPRTFESRDLPSSISQRIIVRARGNGSFALTTMSENIPLDTKTFSVETNQWEWFEMPFAAKEKYFPLSIFVEPVSGAPILDVIFLETGPSKTPHPASSISLPATSFFRAGKSLPETGDVTFRKNRDQAEVIMYGTLHDLPEGEYDFSINYSSSAPTGTHLADLEIITASGILKKTSLLTGDNRSLHYTKADNLPMRINFRFHRKADMIVHSLNIARN